MRYTYLIKDQSGKQEEYKAMSYRKLLKKLSSKYKEQIYSNTSTTASALVYIIGQHYLPILFR